MLDRGAPEDAVAACAQVHAHDVAAGRVLLERRAVLGDVRDVADAVDYFGLPLDRTILVGSEIPL